MAREPTIMPSRACYTSATPMRHLYADFIDRVAKPARYLGGEYQAVVKDGRRSTRGSASRSPTSTTSGCPTSGPRSSTRCSTRTRGSRASARSRRGSTWRPSCARAACRWCRSRRQRPLARVRRARHLAAVRADVHERAHAARPRRHPAARGRSRATTRRSCSSAGRPRRTPSRWRRSSTPRSSARPRSSCRRSCSRGRRCAARSARARARARDALAELAARFPLYVPSLYETEVDAATGMTVVGAPLDPRVPARVRARWSRTSTRIRSRPTRRCRTPRRCSSARPSRSRAAAPRAAGSARPA